MPNLNFKQKLIISYNIQSNLTFELVKLDLQQMISQNDLIQIFKTTLSKDQIERQNAQTHLITLCQTQPNFLHHLLAVMESSSQELELSMAAYTLRYIQWLTKNHKQKDIYLKNAQTLIQALDSQKISKKSKVLIKGALTTLIVQEQSNTLYQRVVQDLVKRLSQTIPPEKYEFIGSYIHICLCKQSKTPVTVISKFYIALLQFSNSVLFEIKNTSLQDPELISKIQILKILLYPLRSIVSYTSFFVANKNNIGLLYQQSLNELIFQCLTLRCREDKLISIKKEYQYDVGITTIKAIVSHIFHSCLKVLVQVDQLYRKINPVYSKKQLYLQELFNCIYEIFKEKNYHLKELIRVSSINDIVTVTTECGNIPQFSPYYNKNKEKILQNYILPILELNKNNQQLYQSQPQQFFNSQIYTINRGIISQNSEEILDELQTEFTLEVNSIKLIHYFCRYIDGMTTLFVNNCISGLEKSDKHSALIILNSLVQKLQDRPDLIGKVKSYISESLSKPQTHENTTEKVSFYLNLLLAYRYNSLISKIDKGFNNQVWQFVIKVLNSTQDNSLKYLCIEIILTIIIQGFSTLYEQRSQTLNTLVAWISANRSQDSSSYTVILGRVLDCIEEIINKSPELSMMQATILNCIKEVVQVLRILYEKGQGKEPLLVNKCWNIIKSVVDAVKAQKSFVQTLEVVVVPLYRYLKISNIDQQDFIYVIQVFISSAGVVFKQYQIQFLSLIPTFFQKNKQRFFDLFECINIYLYYGSEVLGKNISYLQNILRLVIKVLDKNQEQQEEDQICEAVLILQNLIYNCQKSLKEEHWTTIIEATFSRLNRYIKHSFLKSNLIVVLALTFVACFNQLQNSEISKALLQQMLSIVCFTERFPSKMLIICFCQILKKVDSPLVHSHYVQIFDSAITLTRVSHWSNQKMDQSDSQDQQIDKQVKGYKILMKRFQSPMTRLDQFEIMKQLLTFLKENFHNLFLQVVQQLPEPKKDFLKTVIQIQKVSQKQYRSIIKVRRQ